MTLSVVLSLLVVVQPAAAGQTATARADVSTLAAPSCPSGSFCIWPVADHSSSRCSWSNADADWRSAPVVCSWAATRPVRYVYNHGTSTAYGGVCLYTGANYTSPSDYDPRGSYYEIGGGGEYFRSHRWVSNIDACG
ncbi:peptidase inhibitor family I36 protein [Cryptosporangium sp. NPDC051539]|uniref:peptidase inhibitor family I36 protein n=1 Tax=Cryptosporangium sp. NPDC051539 TaxID=3363962 RepID=UPI003791F54E